ncbi:hypothetical protein BD779DRAFT_1558756 [Infundibulicybe gibba]|nr:hypothetical protein BD779DRAFT_1558756 [Infundibulicybe gibba]
MKIRMCAGCTKKLSPQSHNPLLASRPCLILSLLTPSACEDLDHAQALHCRNTICHPAPCWPPTAPCYWSQCPTPT